MRVLVTSFEPFDGHELNSSLEVGRALGPLPGVELSWTTLPVVAGLCVERAWEQVQRKQPEVLVALGQAGSSPLVRLEDRAVNFDHFALPDNSNQVRTHSIIVPGAPALLRTPIPLSQLHQRLQALGQPVQLSFSAGSFVCNHLYFHLLHRASARLKVLFVHLPLLPTQPAAAHVHTMPLERQVECVRQTILACVELLSGMEQEAR